MQMCTNFCLNLWKKINIYIDNEAINDDRTSHWCKLVSDIRNKMVLVECHWTDTMWLHTWPLHSCTSFWSVFFHYTSQPVKFFHVLLFYYMYYWSKHFHLECLDAEMYIICPDAVRCERFLVEYPHCVRSKLHLFDDKHP